MNTPLPLVGIIQHYAWGRPAAKSIIAALSAWRGSQTKPLAELWFGSHPKAPALVQRTQFVHDEPLDLLLQNQAANILGERVQKRYGSALPFLFKILSVGTPLSIQAHPDRARARLLHARDPAHYPDQEHKPEVAVAISELQALHGFLSPREIADNLRAVPEFGLITAPGTRTAFIERGDAASLKALYREILFAPKEALAAASAQLLARLRALPATRRSPADRWVMGLAPSYPQGDVGLFHFYLMRRITVSAGEAIFTPPNVPHAYLTGEIVECMALSDNVVRAGLTTKFCDASTLVEMLDYAPSSLPVVKRDAPDGLGFSRFLTSADEFVLGCCRTPIRAGRMPPTAGPRLLFCLEGSGELFAEGVVSPFSAGSCFLLPACSSGVQMTFSGGALFVVDVPA